MRKQKKYIFSFIYTQYFPIYLWGNLPLICLQLRPLFCHLTSRKGVSHFSKNLRVRTGESVWAQDQVERLYIHSDLRAPPVGISQHGHRKSRTLYLSCCLCDLISNKQKKRNGWTKLYNAHNYGFAELHTLL